MLTGDKKETAVNLAQAAGLIKSSGMPHSIRTGGRAVKPSSTDRFPSL